MIHTQLPKIVLPLLIPTVFVASVHGQVTWDGGSATGPRWQLADNWNPNTDPTNSPGLDFVFTGNAIEAFGVALNVNSMSAGDNSSLRIRNNAAELTGDFTMTGSTGSNSNIVSLEDGRGLTINGTGTFGGSDFFFNARDNGETLTLTFTNLAFQPLSTISKRGNGILVINTDGITANSNIFDLQGGTTRLIGSADYSSLALNIQSDALLDVTTSITLSGLVIDGNAIAAGTYSPGSQLFTDYAANLGDSGGTLTVIPESSALPMVLLVGFYVLRRQRRE